MATLGISATSIGPQKWKSESLNTIRNTLGLIQRSDRSNSIGRSTDPLPHNREVLGELSNKEALKYGRQVRVVTNKLRESFISTNEEIKSILPVRNSLEKQLEHVRKDIKLNNESIKIRHARPAKEKQIGDGADDLLNAEKMHLRNLKQELETHLKVVMNQIQALDESRRRLQAVLRERTRVTDLHCNTVNASNPRSDTASFTSMRQDNSSMGQRCLSARSSVATGDASLFQLSDPLSPYTPEVEAALKEAGDIREDSKMTRDQVKGVVGRVQKMQETAHRSVNEGISKKIAETASLKQHLLLAKIDNRSAVHRAQRWHDSTERAFHSTQGPESARYLTHRERLDRPIIRVYQRHPGTQLPEAQEIIRTGEGLLDSLVATSKNIELLRGADSRLREDLIAKTKAMDVDLVALRNRRNKADHRWNLGQKTS